MKTFERLDYCPHIQPITLIFPKSAPTFHDCVSVSKICTSGDLHRTIRGPASHHPRTCITPSVDLHHTIRGPASEHLDLHQAIRTCIIINTVGIISKMNLIIDEIFISEQTLSLTVLIPSFTTYLLSLYSISDYFIFLANYTKVIRSKQIFLQNCGLGQL